MTRLEPAISPSPRSSEDREPEPPEQAGSRTCRCLGERPRSPLAAVASRRAGEAAQVPSRDAPLTPAEVVERRLDSLLGRRTDDVMAGYAATGGDTFVVRGGLIVEQEIVVD